MSAVIPGVILFGDAGNNTLNGGAGDDGLSGFAGDDLLNGGAGCDVLRGRRGDDLLNGGADGDLLDGGDGEDTLNGDGGDDNILGRDGNDILNGDVGNDTLRGGHGDDTLNGGDNDDVLRGGFGNDMMLGGSGMDTLRGGPGDDFMDGGADADIIRGGRGDDTIDGGEGVDTMIGNLGNDRFVMSSADDGDVVKGGADDNGNASDEAADLATGDTLDLSSLDLSGVTSIRVDLDEVNQGALNGNPRPSQNGFLDINDGATVVDLNNIENIIGSDFGEVLFGNNEANVILAEGGNDTIHPFGGVDFVDGGDGTDILLLNAANGPVPIDIAAGTAGPNTFINIENASGSVNFGDMIFGDGGVNLLRGNGGDDTIVGRQGNDSLEGGDDDDLIIWNNGDGSDNINGGNDDDVVQVNGADGAGDIFTVGEDTDGNGIAEFARTNLGLFELTIDEVETLDINGQGGDDSLTASDLSGTDVSLLKFDGGDGNDVLDAVTAGIAVKTNGGIGQDTLTGSSESDSFVFDEDVFDGLGEDRIDNFSITGNKDVFALVQEDFGVEGDLKFVNSLAANLPDDDEDINVIVLRDSDDDGNAGTAFNARSAARLIAAEVDEDTGEGFFVYFNSMLNVNRLAFSEDLSDGGAALEIVARLTDLTGQAAIDALPDFTEDNFAFVGEDFLL